MCPVLCNYALQFDKQAESKLISLVTRVGEEKNIDWNFSWIEYTAWENITKGKLNVDTEEVIFQ